MKAAHFEHFFAGRFSCLVAESCGDEIVSGSLIPLGVESSPPVPIVRGIPRFCPTENYADNFGLQWNVFRSTQLDSMSGLPLTANRFWANTHWRQEELRGRTVLEVGSGAGRFTEVLLNAGCRVVSFDYSDAVDANWLNNGSKGDLLLLQADLYDLPFDDASFDFVFCYGVLQHTPDPDEAYRSVFHKLRPGGTISIDYYRRFRGPTPWSTPKYLWRPLTTRMQPTTLLRIVRTYIPLWFPVDTLIRRIPRIGHRLAGLVPIPCWNYTGSGLSRQQCLEWAVMDTFDALGAAYDTPRTIEEVRAMIDSPENETAEVFYGSNGIVANVRRRQ